MDFTAPEPDNIHSLWMEGLKHKAVVVRVVYDVCDLRSAASASAGDKNSLSVVIKVN
jgi:hypothetical protein